MSQEYGSGSVYMRGKTPWIKFYRDGSAHYMSCRGLTERQAREKLKAEMRKSDAEFNTPREKRVTIEELLQDAVLDYEANGMPDAAVGCQRAWDNHLSAHFRGVRAHEFGTVLQQKYRVARGHEKAKVSTVNRELQFLQKAFRVAYESEPSKVKRMPKFNYPAENNRREGRVDLRQLERLKEAASRHSLEWRILIEMAVWLGWRKGELVNLRVKNIFLYDGGEFGCVRIADSKNGHPREVPLTENLRYLLSALILDRRSDDSVFGFTRIRYVWKKLVAEAECPDLIFHDLRRISAITKRSAGVPESVIMEMHGWRTANMFRRYAITGPDDMLQAHKKQAQYEARVLGPKAGPTVINAVRRMEPDAVVVWNQ